MIHTDWGIISYEEAWERQKYLFAERLDAKQKNGRCELPDILVSCEHTPVFTLGKSGKPDNLLVSEDVLKSKEVDFYRIDRGGDITFHGPGQLVMYPIFDLEHYGIGLKEYIFRLEEAVILFLSDYGLQASRLEGATGVWMDPHTRNERKICAIGVKASRYVTMHGIGFNINTDLSYFQMIHPCGFSDKGVTSLQKELGGRLMDMNECRQGLRIRFEEVFGD